MITDFTPYQSLTGGVLIGLSAVMLMAFNGRIAGMTGILGGILPPYAPNNGWRIAFLIGAVAAPVLYVLMGGAVPFGVPISTAEMIVGGFIVGIGVTYGSGCTSGHGVCGMARLSPRSIVATITFMITTGLTVYVMRHVIGG
ncbi:MAG: YeeE/YedE family protein [Notoacmeibacter sp.]|nr:YeeE/YedE family protein [Notoacmeibacter sp.]MCC0032591.1 YeeE/YedE family protein [Brucellaceae bacterium]